MGEVIFSQGRRIFFSFAILMPTRITSSKLYFFSRGHSDESCNLIASLRGPYFPISAYGQR